MDDHIHAELESKKNQDNPQGKQGTSSTILFPSKAQLARDNCKSWMNNNQMNPIRKRKKFNWCKKSRDFKLECRKYQAFLRNRNRQHQNLRNDQRHDGRNQSNRDFDDWNQNSVDANKKIDMQGLVSAFQAIANQSSNRNESSEPPFGEPMENIKFRTNTAEVSEEKSSNAFIDSGAPITSSTAGRIHKLFCYERRPC